MRTLLILSLVASASAQAVDFYQFMIRFEKNYSDPLELLLREKVFNYNDGRVKTHNMLFDEGHVTYNLAHNKYSDLTFEEFNKMMKGLKMPPKLPDQKLVDMGFLTVLPISYDWRTHGAVTPVKDQDRCASSYAFAAIGAIEAKLMVQKKNKSISLSEQQIVDCSRSNGNDGCQGGSTVDAFAYIKSARGIQRESDYPYTAKEGICNLNLSLSNTSVSNYLVTHRFNETALQYSLVNAGPIAIAIDTSSWTFQFYSSGIYTNFLCSSTNLDHAALLVGYGTENFKDYWIIKNSWGTSWGEEGYIRMSRNLFNQCGVATWGSYPVVS